MKNTFIEIIKLIIGPVTGAAIALFVNFLIDIRNKKPLIVFSLDCVYDVAINERINSDYSSGYQIICYNIGHVPVFINSIEIYKLFHKKDFLIDIIPTTKMETKSLMPFATMNYDISVKELDGIIKYCKTNNYIKLNINAYGVDNKKYKGIINLWWITAIADENEIINNIII